MEKVSSYSRTMTQSTTVHQNQKKKLFKILSVIDWLAQPLDINAIELLWESTQIVVCASGDIELN